MSFILDALRKAEKDRQLGKIPGLGDVTATPTRAASAAALPPRTLALLALVLALLALTVWLWPREAPTPLAVAAPPAAAPAPNAPPAVEVATERAFEADSGVGRIAEPDVEPALEDGLVAESIDDLLDATPESTGGPAESGNALAATADGASESEVGGDHGAAPAESGSDPSAISGVPLLREMPSDYRDAFPPLRVDVHVYDDDPARRWVIINGSKAVEGSALGEGPRLAEIRPDGLLLEWRGRPVLVPLNR